MLGTLVALLSTSILSPVPLVTPAVAQARAPVTVTVLSVNPLTPAITSTARSLTITVSLDNTTDATLSNVTLTGERGTPIGTQTALNSSLADSAARTDGKPIITFQEATVSLPPGGSVTTTFRTTTSKEDHQRICLCANAVYPIDLTARTVVDGAAEVLGGTRTYLPVFDEPPSRKIGVTWIWPLIDRPHRDADGTVFTDDDLATSVAGGRLDRALQVVEKVEQVPNAVPLTLFVDPELLDELQTMSLGRYTVRASNGTVTAGTGQQAAAGWLTRLQAVLADNSSVDVELTPLADPDVTGLSQHHLSWSTGLSTAVAANVSTALGGDREPTHTLAWPPANSATVKTLDRLVAGGADTVVLDGSRVRPSTRAGIPVSVARLRTSAKPVTALLTSPALQRYAQAALGGSTGALPALVAELAIRVAQNPGSLQNAVLTAQRYVDPPSIDVAANTILTTSRSVFSQPVSAIAATDALPASTARSSVRSLVATSTGLTTEQLDTISSVTGYLKPVESLIGGVGGSAAGRLVVAALPSAVQRTESAAWSRAGAGPGVGGGPTPGAERARVLAEQLSGYLTKVNIRKPSSGSYTLASSDAPLPISVRNDSPLSVRVRVSVDTVGGLPGLPASEIGVVQVAGNSTRTFKIPTRVQRSGRIPVQAQLYTADNYRLGDPVMLIVHSTVLGTIGVVITITSGIVLVLALIVRYVRRVLRIRTRRAQAASS